MIDLLVSHSPDRRRKADTISEDRVYYPEWDDDQRLRYRRPCFRGSSLTTIHDFSDLGQYKGHSLAVQFCPRVLLFPGAPTYARLGHITKGSF